MVSKRPSNLETPKTWSEFERNGRNFVIQDLTDDMFQDAVNILTEHFVNDEPPSRCIGLKERPDALQHLVNLWDKTLKHGLSLVCITKDENERPVIVAVNVLTIAEKTDTEEFQTDNLIWRMLFGAVELVANSVNVFEEYKVERYLNAYGLVVKPEFRGFNIGTEMLKARVPLCKALGLKITATVFTAIASQKCAEKAGFKTISEITYEDMAKKYGYIFPDIEKHTKSSKLMVLVVE